ncbi:MAG: 2-oxoacid:acceptor oxidoreductase family protein [Candidatus Marinimicrobia bacterium]|nr:2-oxoacid:acceptor oxidoreductase family protein [Candidatus Neomarinimicrobiota bacterium]MCF7829958.1 2-oxoacid:acceptor oxidoreductase family protein [Candidatus Neomarinimicrobiota bacterium]MCF7881888.1 2-oxoacid:acceptor oxidoreductase family protein [Candidatus Neomarinimicrobiota bacterium]
MSENILKKPESFYDDFQRKPGADTLTTHYCPGCAHGVLHKLVAEALDDLGVREKTIFISPVGCSVFAYYYFHTGNVQAAHGRASAVATAVKRAHPDSIVISYQGDGDLAGIGGNNILQAANRGENFTTIFVNNAIYGMTGGQMAPTTLIGQKTTTTPRGRAFENEGYPMRVSELLATLDAPSYIERVMIGDPKYTMKARKAIRKAIKAQIEGKGFSLVEALSACPSGWKMTPVEAKNWVQEEMTKIFPLGVTRDKIAEIEGKVHNRNGNGRKPLSDKELVKTLDIPEAETSTIYPLPEVEDRYKHSEIKIAGFGGQGVLSLGVALSQMGMIHQYHVSWLPSYGPEMRGGTAHCHVKLDHEPIGAPLIENPTILVAMNKPSMDKFEPNVVEGGDVFYNSSLIDEPPSRTDVNAIPVNATEIADELGNTKAANIVMLGGIIAKTGILELEAVVNEMHQLIKKKQYVDLNVKAVKAGFEAVQSMSP